MIPQYLHNLTALGTADKINQWLFAEMYFILIFFMENSNLSKEEKNPLIAQ